MGHSQKLFKTTKAIGLLIDSEIDQFVCLKASLEQWAGCWCSTGTDRISFFLRSFQHKMSQKTTAIYKLIHTVFHDQKHKEGKMWGYFHNPGSLSSLSVQSCCLFPNNGVHYLKGPLVKWSPYKSALRFMYFFKPRGLDPFTALCFVPTGILTTSLLLCLQGQRHTFCPASAR